jgi:hypothetical protein
MGGFALMMSKDGEGNNKNQEVQKKTRTAHKKPEQKGDE